MKKRILCVLLTLALLIPTLAIPAGAVVGEETSSEAAVRAGEFEDLNKQTFAYLQNDYISFYLLVDAVDPLDIGLVSYTVPTDKIVDYGLTDLSIYGARRMGFLLNGTESINGNRLAPFDPFYLTVKSVKYTTDASSGTLTADYTFTNDNYTAKSVYALTKLQRGLLDPGDEGMIGGNSAQPDNTENWGVTCETTFTPTIKCHADITFIETYDKFPKLGHPNAEGNASMFASVVSEYQYNGSPYGYYNILGVKSVTRSNISKGMGQKYTYSSYLDKNMATTEVYTDVYPNDNPFVALSDVNRFIDKDDVYNFSLNYPEYVYYKDSLVTTWSNDYGIMEDTEGSTIVSPATFNSLWGYRDLKKFVEREPDQAASTAADQPTYAADAGYLAVVRQNADKYTVVPCGTSDDLMTLKSTNTVVAAYLCSYEYIPASGFYKIKNGVIGLSNTVSASWDPENTAFSVKNDGTLVFDKSKVSLSSLTFKFYQPKSGGGLTFSGYDDKGLIFEIDPKKNDAVVSLNFPGCVCQLEKAVLSFAGDLTFEGTFGIETLFNAASFDMDKFAYGLKNGDFKLNGVHAKGQLGVHAGKPTSDSDKGFSILGLGAGNVEGEINTFNGEEKYDFALSLNVRDLFTAAAELKLRRLNNGRLCPNDLWVYVNLENGMGIDIPTPVPAVTLTGGGFGVKGLADTINGNYTLVPPVALKLGVTGKVVKGITGTMTGQIGPSILSLEAQDMGISIPGTNSNLRIIDKMGARLFAQGKTLNYKGDVYTGVNFGGGFDIGLCIFNIPENATGVENGVMRLFNNTIEAGAGLEVSGIIAQNNSKTRTYAGIESAGYAKAKLNIPKGITGLSHNIKLASADINFKIGAQSAIPNNASVKEFFRNMEVTGGVVAGASILLLNGRLIYLIPKTVKFEGQFKSFEDWDWDSDPQKYTKKKQSGAYLACEPMTLETEDGKEIVALMALSMAPAQIQVSKASNSVYGWIVQSAAASIPDGENLLLAVKPADQNVIEEFASSLKLDGITLKFPARDADGYIDGSDTTSNAWIGTYSAETDPDTNEIINEEQAVFIRLSKAEVQSLGGKFDISADYDIETIKGAETVPMTALDCNIASGKLNAAINNPESNGKYSIEVYYGEKDTDGTVKAEHLIYSGDITDTGSFTLPTRGCDAPSGNYYVSAYLVQTITSDAGEEAEIPIDSYISDSTITYTNNAAPGAPANAEIMLIGNEGIQGKWDEVDGADGYIVSIYREDGSNGFVDTGRGYSFTADSFSEIDGLSYDSVAKEYTINMGITLGDNGGSETVTGENGEKITIDGGDTKHLDPETSYKIGVRAFKTTTVKLDEDTIQGSNYSAETLSDALYLPKYVKVSITPYLDNEPIEKSDDDIYSAIMGGVSKSLYAKSDHDNVTFTYTNMTSKAKLTTEYFSWADTYGAEIDSTDFEGMLMIEIKASYTHDGVTDDSYEYVLIEKDETAPIIVLDSMCFEASDNGSFTVTGSSEANAKIMAWGNGNSYQKETTAEGSGAFAADGVLEEGEDSAEIELVAIDKAGNWSSTAIVTVSRTQSIPAASGATVTFDPNGGSGSIDSITIYSGGLVELPKCTFAPPAETEFDCWQIGNTKYEEGSSVTADTNITVKAVWKAADVKYVWSSDNKTVKAVYTPENGTVQTETVNTTAAVTKQATCDEKGETTYTADFTNAVFKSQTKTVDNIPALGHSYTFSKFEWTGYDSAQAVFVCDNDSNHKTTVLAEITSYTDKDGNTVHKATAVFDGEEYTDIKIENQSDPDTDTKADTDTDSNTESDTDSDTNSDIGSDTDSGVESDTDSNTYSDTDSGSKSDTDSDTQSVIDEPNGIFGDVDGDGDITANDALTILRASIGMETLTPEQTALSDVDGDGEITANDALAVLRYSVGMSDADSPIGKPIV